MIKDQSAKLTDEVKTFNTNDLTKADQTITDIKALKFVKTVDEKRDAQVKELTADLYKAANTQVAQVKSAKYSYNKIDAAGKAFDTLNKTIKGLKSLSADQIKTLTNQLNKDKKTVVDNLNKQKAAAEKKAAAEAAAQEQAQQEATQAASEQVQAEAQQGSANYDAGAPASNSQYTAPTQQAPASGGGYTAPAQQAPSAPQDSVSGGTISRKGTWTGDSSKQTVDWSVGTGGQTVSNGGQSIHF